MLPRVRDMRLSAGSPANRVMRDPGTADPGHYGAAGDAEALNWTRTWDVPNVPCLPCWKHARAAYGGWSSGRTASQPERFRIDVGALEALAHDSRCGLGRFKRSAWL